jgi:hypothetical protein
MSKKIKANLLPSGETKGAEKEIGKNYPDVNQELFKAV